MSTLAITYRKNPLYSDGTLAEPRLFATIDLRRYGADTTITDLPIYFRQLDKPAGPVRMVYWTRAAGLLLERGNLESLVTVLDRYLGALIRFERLPEYVFHVGSNAWPIYRLPGQLVTRYPGGPVFSATNIAELRVWLADHFKRAGRIQSRDELGILYLSHSDLQLYAPVCTLRSPATADIPVFRTQNGHGKQLLAPVESESIAVPINSGVEVLNLHQKVREFLVAGGRLADPYELTVRHLPAHTWSRARATLKPYSQTLSYYTEVEGKLSHNRVPVFTHDSSLIAAQTNHLGRVSLYLGPDVQALQVHLGTELYRQGTISGPDTVRIVSARREERVSMLDRLLQAPAYL